MRNYLAVLTLLMALSSGVWAIGIDEWGLRVQPDGTTFEAHVFGDEFAGHKRTADGYEFVYGSDGWYYYAELDAQGEYRASPYKVGIDDPASNGIPRNLQRSAVRNAEINAVRIAHGYANGLFLTQPDGTEFIAYDQPLSSSSIGCDRADGYVLAIFLAYEEGVGYSDAIPLDVRTGDPASEGWYDVINYNKNDHRRRSFPYDIGARPRLTNSLRRILCFFAYSCC